MSRFIDRIEGHRAARGLMRNALASLALSLGLAAGAGAAAVVATGSTYSVLTYGESSGVAGATGTFTTTFDGVSENFSSGNQRWSVTESESAVGGNQHRILVSLTAAFAMFPAAGEGAYIGLGSTGNGLDFLSPVYLEQAFIRFYTDGTEVFASTNLADDYRSDYLGDWSGQFSPGGLYVIGNVGGAGINNVTFEFLVTDQPERIPEPGTLALIPLAAGVAWSVRRRRAARAD